MTPIIYSAQILDPTRDFTRCAITPGVPVDLHEESDGRIGILCQRRAAWFNWKRRSVLVGFLDQPNAELMKPHLAQLDSLRVRIVSASGAAKKPTNACISVWGNVSAAGNCEKRPAASIATPVPVPAALPAE